MTTEFPKTVCELGMPGPMRDRLVQGVLSGKKSATSSLLIEWEQDGDQLPEVGDRSTVIDSSGVPVAILELTQIDVLRLEEVGPDVPWPKGKDSPMWPHGGSPTNDSGTNTPCPNFGSVSSTYSTTTPWSWWSISG